MPSQNLFSRTKAIKPGSAPADISPANITEKLSMRKVKDFAKQIKSMRPKMERREGY